MEEPLEIQVGSSPLAVVMRTPGHDEELAVGFLLTEQVVSTFTDIASVRHCTVLSNPEAEDNVIRVTLKSGVPFDPKKLQRNLFTSSSCGICGKASIDRVLKTAPPLEDESVFPAEYFYGLPDRLREAQAVFSETGGLHGAGLFDSTGRLLAAREDVGRHNAVDKVVGWALRDGRVPLTNHALMVSGRISFEIVQKALAARIPVIAAVSAASSLAIKLADEAGMTIIGFLRGSGMNVYSRLNRIKGSPGNSSE
jgi:FdhD protein